MYILGFGKVTKVPPLNEEMAVELGADILGEVFIFGTAAVLLTLEYVRSSANSRAKEDAQERRLVSMETRLVEVDLKVEEQQAKIRELERNLAAAQTSTLKALRDKLLPGTSDAAQSSEVKGESRRSGSFVSPPGTRTVTLERAHVLRDDRSEQSFDSLRPVPQWRRPFLGSDTAPTTKSGSTTEHSDKGTLSTSAAATAPTATTSASETYESPILAQSDEQQHSSTSFLNADYRNKIIRRALKILIDAYEEMEDDD